MGGSSLDTKYLREICGNITQKELSELYGIPLGTIKNWDARHCMPKYVFDLIHRLYMAQEDRDKLIEENVKLKQEINERC